MKKIILSMILAAAAMNINAQLVVDSLGRVNVATLSVGNSENDNAAIICSPSGKKYGLRMVNYSSNANIIYGDYINYKNTMGDCMGVKSIASGNNDMNSSQCVIGLSGNANRAQTAIGVYGGKNVGTSSYMNFAGVYGSDTGNTPSFHYGIHDYSGIYAGYFSGMVRVTNGIYATVLSPSASTSLSGQGGTSILSDRSESVTDKLSRVQALQFLRYEPDRSEATTDENEEGEDKAHLSPVQYGLDATQLKAVYPELVYEDANGNVSINYVEMVPLLVQSINELKSELAELKGTTPKKAKAESTAIEETVSDVDMVRMDQNNPNPFSESTVIALNIPEQTQAAKIFIYDMSGKQVQDIAVSERSETNITVYASDLTAGMYIYTLVVDGKVEVTRKMIVEK